MEKEIKKAERILHLTLKKKWYDMIASGEKKEEYRDVKEYWEVRLKDWDGCYKVYDYVLFKNGYSKDAPSMKVEFKGIYYNNNPNPKWIDGDLKDKNGLDKHFYIIKLGKVIWDNKLR
jgi:hypothetical protein